MVNKPLSLHVIMEYKIGLIGIPDADGVALGVKNVGAEISQGKPLLTGEAGHHGADLAAVGADRLPALGFQGVLGG